jgi:hypothetical protein
MGTKVTFLAMLQLAHRKGCTRELVGIIGSALIVHFFGWVAWSIVLGVMTVIGAAVLYVTYRPVSRLERNIVEALNKLREIQRDKTLVRYAAFKRRINASDVKPSEN